MSIHVATPVLPLHIAFSMQTTKNTTANIYQQIGTFCCHKSEDNPLYANFDAYTT